MFWTMHSGIVAVIAMVFARYFATFVPLTDAQQVYVAVTAIVALSGINYLGVRPGSAVQVVLTVIKVLALVGIIILAVITPAHGTIPPAAGPADARAFLVALIAGLFAFGGWHMVSYAAEETVSPERTIPRSLLIGTLLVTALYIAVNASYLHVLPLNTVIQSKHVAADFADATLAGGGAQIMAALVVLSTLGAMNGVILAGPRVYLAMADDGLLFRWIGGVHPTYRTPHRAIVLQAVWSSVLVLTGTYRVLFTRVVYTEWIFFAMLAVALFLLRRRSNYAPSYRAWGYPVLPALFAISSLVIVANQVISDPRDSAIGIGLVLIGLPVNYLRLRRLSVRTT
jgi:APA family basic amino acid/polyamine antiporter